jgi:uncharacterized membrane protein
MADTRKRSYYKGLSYRAVGSATTVVVATLITGSAPTGLAIGIVELISKLGLFYFHERLWARVTWGQIEEAREVADEAESGAITPPQIVRPARTSVASAAGGQSW